MTMDTIDTTTQEVPVKKTQQIVQEFITAMTGNNWVKLNITAHVMADYVRYKMERALQDIWKSNDYSIIKEGDDYFLQQN